MSSSNKQAMNERKKVLFDQSLFFCFQQGYYTASPKTKTAYDEDLYPHLSLKTKNKKKKTEKRMNAISFQVICVSTSLGPLLNITTG